MSVSMSEEVKQKLDTLTEKELMYYRLMNSQYGVPYIKSKPGIAKSAMVRNIAKKMGYNYIDMRLSMNDESDFKFPYLADKDYNGGKIKVSGYAVPKWAYDSNEQPTIIHFEELNRAPQFVRNAALQILLEREIGDFEFNDNVMMIASGNLGDEDGTDVEEMDSALVNRLIHINHTLSVKEWLNDFAIENCHPMISSYIETHPERLDQKPDENTTAYATPRSWTMLSEFIVKNFGMDSSPKEFLSALRNVATGFIGNSSVKFLQYCHDMTALNIQDIIDNYDNVKNDLKSYNRDKNTELIQSLKKIDLTELKTKQLDNVSKFVETIGDDEKTAYLLSILDDPSIDISNKKVKNFLLKFKDTLSSIKEVNKSDV